MYPTLRGKSILARFLYSHLKRPNDLDLSSDDHFVAKELETLFKRRNAQKLLEWMAASGLTPIQIHDLSSGFKDAGCL
jgi:hypothetical protein